MKITVDVTEDDIKSGRKSCCSSCPVALALNRATGTIWSVSYCTAYETEGDVIHKIFLPHEADLFIFNFDHGIPVQPFSFEATMKVVP